MGGGYHDLSNDITITTFRSLPSCATEKCKLLLVDELQSTVGDEISAQLCKMSPIRVFGYTATDKGMFNKAEKLVKGLFGERLIHIEYQEAEGNNAVVPVTVWLIRTPMEIMVSAASMEGKLRQGIKKAKLRNQLVAQACIAVPNNRQTLVFVDHIADHLIPLFCEMPIGTRYVHRGTSKSELGVFAMSPKQQKGVIADYQENKFQYLIATDAFRAGVDVPNCSVVIQASGGCSEIEILQEAFRGSRILPKNKQEELGVPEKTHLVLIDFIDQHEPSLMAMSEKRRQIYDKQGWLIKEVDDVKDIDWNLFEPTRKS